MKPVLERHAGICVVRDDLYEGGTKARIFEYLYSQYNMVVYATMPFSKTQGGLAAAAKRLGKQATLFIPRKDVTTKETLQAKALGATVIEIPRGYMSVLEKRARDYVKLISFDGHNVYKAPLGFDTPDVLQALASTAKSIDYEPEEVWCAAGSGTLSRALQLAWPSATHYAVQVGKHCDVGKANRIMYPMKLERKYKGMVPFDADRQYEAKAWHLCVSKHDRHKRVLFWNVTGE